MRLTEEQQMKIVRENLKWDIKYMLKKGSDPHESYDNKVDLLSALYKVLKHYSRDSKYQKFLEKTKGRKLG